MNEESNKKRSPKYPFITLEKALEYLPKLVELNSAGNLTRQSVLAAMGFESMSGPAARTLAAIHAYHFTRPSKNGPALTETGLALAQNRDDLASRQIAALSPMMFRRLWRRSRNASETELTDNLIARGFSAEGAAKAAQIYRANADFCRLDDLGEEPELPNPKAEAIEERRQRKFRKQPEEPIKKICLPFSTGVATIPRGISEEEFQLLIKTLHLWKDQITRRN